MQRARFAGKEKACDMNPSENQIGHYWNRKVDIS